MWVNCHFHSFGKLSGMINSKFNMARYTFISMCILLPFQTYSHRHSYQNQTLLSFEYYPPGFCSSRAPPTTSQCKLNHPLPPTKSDDGPEMEFRWVAIRQFIFQISYFYSKPLSTFAKNCDIFTTPRSNGVAFHFILFAGSAFLLT